MSQALGELFRLMSEAHAFMATYNVPKGQRSWIEVAAKGEIAKRTRDYLNLLQLTSGRTAKHYIDRLQINRGIWLSTYAFSQGKNA